MRGAFDPAQRDKELDGDGVAGEVLFPDADAITGGASPPFGAGLSAADIADPELAFAGARAHNRFLAELCAHSPERRAGVALVPITHDVDRAVAEIEWAAANGLRGGILVPTMWRDHAPYIDPMYEPVWAACAAPTCRCTRTPARRRRTSTRRTSACTSPRWCGGRSGRCGSCCSAARSSGIRT